MIRPAAALALALALASPAGHGAAAQSLLGQSRPGGPQGGSQGGPQGGAAPAPGAAPLAPVQVLPLPGVATPGAGQTAQPLPPPAGPQLQPGQFLPAVPPAPGTTPAPAGPATPSLAPVTPVQSEWVAQGSAELRGVDKVMARTTPLAARPGETLRFGPLSVVVRSCIARPPDRPADAAAFVEVSEGNREVFRGWMVLSQPQLGLVEHATHDIRLFACRP